MKVKGVYFGISGILTKYEYSQNIILVNKESGCALDRAPLTALAVGFDSLYPYDNVIILKELYFSYRCLF